MTNKKKFHKIYLKSQIKIFSTAAEAKNLPLVLLKSTNIPFDRELAMILNVDECLYFRYCFVNPMILNN